MSRNGLKHANLLRRPKLKPFREFGPITEAGCEASVCRVEEASRAFDARAFVAHIKAHPEALKSWDSAESFSEYARRVEAGEYD